MEKTKANMLKKLNSERRRLEQNLAGLTPQEMLIPGVVGAWSIKDVLAHLADWEEHMLTWMSAAHRNEAVETPAPGLTWKQLDIFNERVYQAHRDQPLEEVLGYFQGTHRQFMHMVDEMPEDEMLTHGRYAFIGNGAVYDWLNAYANHDLWAKTAIRAWLKSRSVSLAG